jgi:hypothetical protein
MLRPLRVLGFTLSVIFLGPIAFAALASFLPIAEDAERPRPSDALRLLRTFDDAFPQGVPMSSVDINFYFRQCGYDSIAMLGDIALYRKQKGWSPSDGYDDLSAWGSYKFAHIVEKARTAQLENSLGGFELRFLDRCIANSAFSKVCGFRVRKVLEQSDLYSKYSLPSSLPRPDESGQENTMCAFLDGIAARNGQRLGIKKIGSE